ncbi:MAG: type II toxin-antitoxin system HicB family antitoxin [Dethiobacteria bacterium]|jgi:predicted RNase H-like HicB family nuclease
MAKYKLPVMIERINGKEYMARSDLIRATAVGDTPEEAIENLREAIDAMIEEFGTNLVFKDIDKNIDYRLVEVGNE